MLKIMQLNLFSWVQWFASGPMARSQQTKSFVLLTNHSFQDRVAHMLCT